MGALYYYIKSKDDILSLFQEISSSMLSDFTREHYAELLQMSPQQALNKAVDALITFIDETQDFTLFWYQESKNLKPDELNKLLRYENDVVDLIRGLLQWGSDSGDFEIDDVNVVAQDIMVLCDMWAFRRWSLRHDCSLEKFKDEQRKVISKIVRCRAKTDDKQ